MTKKQFVDEIMRAVETKPKHWRDGQTVFNYIDAKYGVAREVQSMGIDCFHTDENIGRFINESYKLIINGNVHDFPGNNMIEE